jgi:hypothetical protein
VPIVASARLTLNGETLGVLEDVRPDMPWFDAWFVRAEAFAEVEPLFREERELVEAGDLDAASWQSLWERIWAGGIALELPDGTGLERDFAVHVHDDGTARFRY